MSDLTLSRHVLDTLGSAIVTGTTPSGTVYKIEDLQASFGVSRTVVRDALRTLESMNLVESRRSVGVTVAPSQRWDVFSRDIIRWRLESPDFKVQLTSLAVLRASIEPTAASLAARQEGHQDLGVTLVRLAEAKDHAGTSEDPLAGLEQDIEFHTRILRRCGNEMLAALAPVVEQVLRARHDLHLRPRRPHDVPALLHVLVGTAIRDGDAVTAETAMRQLVTEVIDDVERSTD